MDMVVMTITTRLFTFFSGKLVGSDEFGNRYFTEKKLVKQGRTKRWVLYKGLAEPSKISAQWFGWMHHTTDIVPSEANRKPYFWEKPHLPNLTGTKRAYHPDGALNCCGDCVRSDVRQASDYQAWQPE
jgi:NADH:ubiquinone oxidoreductase subunit